MSHPSRPLLITNDEQLLDDTLRLAAAAGVELSVADSAEAAASRWAAAPLALVGQDLAGVLADRSFPRRAGVVIVCGASAAEGASVWRDAVRLGAEHVAVLPEAERWLMDRLVESPEGSHLRGPVVTVVPGRGGVGASTFAVLLARAAEAGLLIDLDPVGGGLDARLEIDIAPGMRWTDLASVRGRLSPTALRGSLPCLGDIAVVSAADPVALPTESLASIIDAGVRSGHPTILDGTRDLAPVSHLAWARSDVVVLCAPLDVNGVLASRALAKVIAASGTRTVAVLRPTRDASLRPFDVEDALGIPIIGQWGHDRSLARGESPLAVPLRSIRHLADAILPRRGASRRAS